MATRLNFDHAGYVMNGPSTFVTLADELIKRNSVIIEWTDDHHTALSILLSVPQVSYPDGHVGFAGLHIAVYPHLALFVAVRYPGAGLAAFPMTEAGWVPMHPDYVGEKLFHVEQAGLNPTFRKIANLINGVIAAWRKHHHLDVGREEEIVE